MDITAFHAKYFAYDLTRRCASDSKVELEELDQQINRDEEGSMPGAQPAGQAGAPARIAKTGNPA